jgi:hypothetical protein
VLTICIVVSVLILPGCGGSNKKFATNTVVGPTPWTHLEFNNNPDHFQFAIVADRSGGTRVGIFESAVAKLNLLQPEFVMCVGDLIEGYTEEPEKLNSQWRQFDSIVGQLEMPFFYVPGNHDITNQTMLELWKKRLGKPYYHFTYRDVLFLCLNSEDPSSKATNLIEEQLCYFQDVLEKNPSPRWTLLFLHKPLWSKNNQSWAKMEQMLNGRSYTVFTGHRHTYRKTIKAGRNYYELATTGGSSKLEGIDKGRFDHIVWVTMTDKGPTIANIPLAGIMGDNPPKEINERLVPSLNVK